MCKINSIYRLTTWNAKNPQYCLLTYIATSARDAAGLENIYTTRRSHIKVSIPCL